MIMFYRLKFISCNSDPKIIDANYDVKMRKWVRNENAMRKKKIQFVGDVCDANLSCAIMVQKIVVLLIDRFCRQCL